MYNLPQRHRFCFTKANVLQITENGKKKRMKEARTRQKKHCSETEFITCVIHQEARTPQKSIPERRERAVDGLHTQATAAGNIILMQRKGFFYRENR
ncbi:hypothetical protein HMPREF1981_03105 [Bacteroides pyogenes F0041]|uniref:Uncharacterized protein n=1 Tax=Bacteroides pyogenes F0041 TaxID=1321819 RepID=U2CAK0_9BACE|nr:hypothetical protein HMPREF1981_03105 [Bacteroides pyogenes F0041]